MAARVASPRWTEADTADFIRCWNDGMPLERLAARFHCGAAARARKLRADGFELTRRKPGPRL